MPVGHFAKVTKKPPCGHTIGYAGPLVRPLANGKQTDIHSLFAYTFCVHKSTLALPRAAHGQATDAQGGLADAHRHGLAGFAAGPDPMVQRRIISNHRDFGE